MGRRSQLNLKDLCFLLWTESGCLLFLMFDLCIVLSIFLPHNLIMFILPPRHVVIVDDVRVQLGTVKRL